MITRNYRIMIIFALKVMAINEFSSSTSYIMFITKLVIKAIGNNEERKEIIARRHKILTWKTLSNKER
jgi:hypothetical protein